MNIVTADLFRKYRQPADYLKVSEKELQKDIRTTGFFRNKAKSIRGTVPGARLSNTTVRCRSRWIELLELPGVARKTANVVLEQCLWDQGRRGCRYSCDAVFRTALDLTAAEDCREDRAGVDRDCASQRVGDFPAFC